MMMDYIKIFPPTEPPFPCILESSSLCRDVLFFSCVVGFFSKPLLLTTTCSDAPESAWVSGSHLGVICTPQDIGNVHDISGCHSWGCHWYLGRGGQ